MSWWLVHRILVRGSHVWEFTRNYFCIMSTFQRWSAIVSRDHSGRILILWWILIVWWIFWNSIWSMIDEIIAVRSSVSFFVFSSESCLLNSIVSCMMSNWSSELLYILFFFTCHIESLGTKGSITEVGKWLWFGDIWRRWAIMSK